jgi:uncharacterized protein with HEPN domain
MGDRSPLPRTLDILEAIDRIHRYTEGMTIEDYRCDNLRRDAVERCLEIILDASKHLPDRYTSRYPDIPWRRVRAFGNFSRHAYFRLDDVTIWEIVTSSLTPLRHAVAEVRAGLQREKQGSGKT